MHLHTLLIYICRYIKYVHIHCICTTHPIDAEADGPPPQRNPWASAGATAPPRSWRLRLTGIYGPLALS
jgi:hypothetical protein